MMKRHFIDAGTRAATSYPHIGFNTNFSLYIQIRMALFSSSVDGCWTVFGHILVLNYQRFENGVFRLFPSIIMAAKGFVLWEGGCSHAITYRTVIEVELYFSKTVLLLKLTHLLNLQYDYRGNCRIFPTFIDRWRYWRCGWWSLWEICG